MADARSRLLGGLPIPDSITGNVEPVTEYASPQKKRAEGANQSKMCLRYVPLHDSPGFKGEWLAMPYSSLWDIRGKRDFSEVAVRYMDGKRVTISGHNLKSIADRLEGGRLGDVIQADPMELAEARHTVTLSVRGDELDKLLAMAKSFRTVQLEGVDAVQASGDTQGCLVTGLRLEEPKEK